MGDGDGGWTGDQFSKGLGRAGGEEIDTNREADRQPRHEACRAGTGYSVCAPLRAPTPPPSLEPTAWIPAILGPHLASTPPTLRWLGQSDDGGMVDG